MARRLQTPFIDEASEALHPHEAPQWGRGSKPSLRGSLCHALAGFRDAFQTQRNLRIQCGLGLSLIALAVILRLPSHKLALVCMLTALVLFAELMNTALEWVLDVYAGTTRDPSVKRIKDVAAAAVLVISIGAAALGVSLFLPHV